jgi:hypothetical protein
MQVFVGVDNNHAYNFMRKYRRGLKAPTLNYPRRDQRYVACVCLQRGSLPAGRAEGCTTASNGAGADTAADDVVVKTSAEPLRGTPTCMAELLADHFNYR